MYTILLNNDNYPITTVRHRIIQFNNLAGVIRFLVYPMYKKEDMKGYNAYLEFVTPHTKTLYREDLVLSDETYRDYLQYELSPDTSITSEYGNVRLRFLFTLDKPEEDGSITRLIRRTSSISLRIFPPDNFGILTEEIPESELDIVNQRIAQMENQIGELSMNKADSIYLFDGGLTLQSNNKNIGNVIDKTSLANAVVDGADEGLVKVVEF